MALTRQEIDLIKIDICKFVEQHAPITTNEILDGMGLEFKATYYLKELVYDGCLKRHKALRTSPYVYQFIKCFVIADDGVHPLVNEATRVINMLDRRPEFPHKAQRAKYSGYAGALQSSMQMF